MPAEFCEQILALCHFLIHGIRFDRTPGAFDAILRIGKNEHRVIITLTDPARNDPRKTLVAVRQINDHDLLPVDPIRPDLFTCGFHALVRHILAALIQCDQVRRVHRRCLFILRKQ